MTQPGVSQHGSLFSFIKEYHVVKNPEKSLNCLFLNELKTINTITQPKFITWYFFKPEFEIREYHQKFH
ncbi:hypothetical protein EXT66_15675 [Pectobacterium carotovorum subsp. carotovorum]|nr:hypothetical protein [Pectobacterium carotovorum subsp. carotovorum]MCL6347952.1 hypothetical protein [Pectobacterium carotovorum subsp. carotovorum]MCL6402694.1 hypothetical protein [Pectobacterium carotovorum subsp. carotovorum]